MLRQSRRIDRKLFRVKAQPRPYHHGNLPEALLRAAERALEEGGVGNISLRELSRTLGVSHTSPRRHFAGKRALLDALAVRGFERLEEALGWAVNQGEQDFRSRLLRLGQAFVGFALKHPALFNLMSEAKHRSDAPPEVLAAGERAYGHGPATFAQAQAAGELVAGDPARLSLVAFSALQGLITISVDGKFKDLPLEVLTDEVIDHVILGLRPRN